MNAEVERFAALKQADEARHGGPAAARLYALQHLKLRTVVKESHCSPVHRLLFNTADAKCGNLLASVGKDQATVYDDTHMGNFISVAVHFTNMATEYVSGGGLQTCTWLSTRGWTEHRHGDSCLAVSGADRNISVISLAEAQVIHLLQGHGREVVALAACPAAPRLLASLGRDGELRTWDVPSDACTSCSPSAATSLAVSPDGKGLVTGDRRGALHCWVLPANQPDAADSGGARDLRSMCFRMKLSGAGHSDAIDSMVFLSTERLATHSADGRVCVWDWSNQMLLSSWKVPHTCAGCGFGASQDGEYVCAGNARGSVYVHAAEDGRRISATTSDKVTAPVKACTLSDDCRHLLAAAGKGFVFRYEYTPRPLAQEGGQENLGAGRAAEGGLTAAAAAAANEQSFEKMDDDDPPEICT